MTIKASQSSSLVATDDTTSPNIILLVSDEFKKLYPKAGNARKNYCGCITAMDQQIGRLRSKLRELGSEKNTVIFFCSDNGPSDGLAKKGVASAGPYKRHKHTMYEGGVLVPACVEWPDVIPAGTSTDVRRSTVDFLPTATRNVETCRGNIWCETERTLR